VVDIKPKLELNLMGLFSQFCGRHKEKTRGYVGDSYGHVVHFV
jgi:hypothetical protein